MDTIKWILWILFIKNSLKCRCYATCRASPDELLCIAHTVWAIHRPLNRSWHRAISIRVRQPDLQLRIVEMGNEIFSSFWLLSWKIHHKSKPEIGQADRQTRRISLDALQSIDSRSSETDDQTDRQCHLHSDSLLPA